MAGSPGAGKSEFALMLVENYSNYVIIDADLFRTLFSDYTGTNSSLFQQACGWLVQQSLTYCLEHGYSFMLDGTFAVRSISKIMNRVIKNSYKISIFYIYQEPEIAWEFTKKREIVEGRHVPKQTFIDAFIYARENIGKIKQRYPHILLNIIVKNYENNISEVHFDAENIMLLVPFTHTRFELEAKLDE